MSRLGAGATAALAPAAAAAETTESVSFTASDGVELQASITGEVPLAPRPVIVEFSPYGRGSQTFHDMFLGNLDE